MVNTAKNILRGGVAISGTLLLVLGSSGASMAATNPLDGLLGGGDSSAQAQVDAGGANLGATLNASGSPVLPGVPSLPAIPSAPGVPAVGSLLNIVTNAAGDVVATTTNAAGDIVTTVTNASGEVLVVVTTTAADLVTSLTSNLLTGGNPGGNPGGTGGSGSTGGDVSMGVETGTGSGGGTGSGLDSRAYLAGGDLYSIALMGASVGTQAAVNTPGAPSAAKDTLAVSAAERTRPIGQGPASDFSWELALVAIGAVGVAGASNIYALRRTRRRGGETV